MCRKHNVGRLLARQWVFGGIDYNTKEGSLGSCGASIRCHPNPDSAGIRLSCWICGVPIGLYRENVIAIESEARYPNSGNVYYVKMQITFHIPEFALKERNLHCNIVHITTVWVSVLVLDDTIVASQTSR